MSHIDKKYLTVLSHLQIVTVSKAVLQRPVKFLYKD